MNNPAAAVLDAAGSTRVGLHVLGLGAIVVTFVTIMLSPSMAGLDVVTGSLAPAKESSTPRVGGQRPERPLTLAQQRRARATAVRFASREVGVRETSVNSSRRIIQYRRAVLGAGEWARIPEPWCADFVSWAWAGAGVPLGFGGRGADYVPELVAWAKVTRRWRAARTGYTPRPGDLIVLRENGSRHGHIGMVARLTPRRVHTIEGNYSDQVARRTVKPWAGNVSGFIVPV
jgi:hypothetical protein